LKGRRDQTKKFEKKRKKKRQHNTSSSSFALCRAKNDVNDVNEEEEEEDGGDDVLQVRTKRALRSRLHDAERVVVTERSERSEFRIGIIARWK